VKKSLEVIRDFHWIVIEQSKTSWNKFYVNFNIPLYELSVRKPLPKNTAIHYDPVPIWFSCKFVGFDPNRKPGAKGVDQMFRGILDEICKFLKGPVKEELEKISQVNYSDVGFFTDYVTFNEKFPSKGEGWFRSVLFIYFRPPANSSEARETLLKVDEIYQTKVVSETKKLLRELLEKSGFTLEECIVYSSKPSREVPLTDNYTIIRSVGFYYLPRTLDEWKKAMTDTLHFLVIFPKSKKVVNSFKELVSSCQTISELSKQIPLYISMFRKETQIHHIKVTSWDRLGVWLVHLEVNEEIRKTHLVDEFDYLRNALVWTKRVVEGNDSSQSEQLTSNINETQEVSP